MAIKEKITNSMTKCQNALALSKVKMINGLAKCQNAIALGGALATIGLAQGHNVACMNFSKISVNLSASASDIAGGVIGVIAGVARIAGIFMVAGGVIKYLQAKSEENSAGESKAAGAIGIGVAFLAMPTILGVVVGHG